MLAVLKVEPRELVSFLGKLVFVSQVVRGGRTYMQGMLAQFKGLIVDWRRGEVKPAGGHWDQMVVTEGFWRDLAWWRENLHYQSLAPLESEPARAEAVLTGTDASDCAPVPCAHECLHSRLHFAGARAAHRAVRARRRREASDSCE